jgi:hypothetical protein
MSYTNKDFPGKVFVSENEYRECVSLRDKLRENIGKNKAVSVEVSTVVKKDNPMLKAIINFLKRALNGK